MSTDSREVRREFKLPKARSSPFYLPILFNTYSIFSRDPMKKKTFNLSSFIHHSMQTGGVYTSIFIITATANCGV